MARTFDTDVFQESRSQRQSRRRPDDSDLDFSTGGADPYAQCERKMARRDRTHESTLDSSIAREEVGRAHWRLAAR